MLPRFIGRPQQRLNLLLLSPLEVGFLSR